MKNKDIDNYDPTDDINYLIQQRDNPTGNYRAYLVNLYNFYVKKAGDKGYCYPKMYEMINATYYGFVRDECAYEMTRRFQYALRLMGYIRYYKDSFNGLWKVEILKPLDF